ncbi:MAG: sulfite exporter TauE/SafE family protein [Bacteroidota bacterium]|uniref:Sulfite exporter TauE/SafE family protein n=1 Tax=Flagellimonas profundi TaxID=2915620 RepID=A0ABS3FH52_9FLAO|nr:sulfite exporter TauE/SafE family protein [Allomuricauda profundi]MBO0342498.1 sulfite exporter TauE/SafE family protein [Allomuricauda profundi]MEC7770782.1 sulfite exporter TauE/SafE family protein [Bacteroidota bacterium]
MLTSALVLGLLGSLHCLGMCGPIAFMLPLDQNNNVKKTLQLSIYHIGRLLAYGVIGILFGLLGKGLSLFGIQQKLSIGIGVLMIVLVLIPAKYMNGHKLLSPIYSIIGKVKSKLGAELKKKTPDTFLTIGFLNGFLPCGLVYMALLGAIAMGSPLEGGLYMMIFGLGTVPLMSLVVYSRGMFSTSVKSRIQKLIPVFVVIIGILFIVRGLGLGIPYVSPKPAPTDSVTATIECHQP